MRDNPLCRELPFSSWELAQLPSLTNTTTQLKDLSLRLDSSRERSKECIEIVLQEYDGRQVALSSPFRQPSRR
jgi:hypothetical protein